MAIWTRKQRGQASLGDLHLDDMSSPAQAPTHEDPYVLQQSTPALAPAAEDLEVPQPSAPAHHERGPRWMGFIDQMSSTRIIGWACDMHNLERSVAVEAVSSTGKRAIAIADILRMDVKEAGYGHGRYGFNLDLKDLRLVTGTLSVRFVEGGVPITKQPIVIDPLSEIINGIMPEKYSSMMQILAAKGQQTFATYEALGSVFYVN